MLDALIRNCGFTDNERQLATRGECAFFALALHLLLSGRSISSELMVAAFGSKMTSWAHALVRHGGRYYDIRGRVMVKSVHAEFRTKMMLRTKCDDLFYFHGMNPLQNDRIAFWHEKLQKPC